MDEQATTRSVGEGFEFGTTPLAIGDGILIFTSHYVGIHFTAKYI